jgi:hypothetical protein
VSDSTAQGQPAMLIIDVEARQQAAIAKQKIDSHEVNCGARYLEINGSLARVHERVDGLMKLMIGNILALLVSAIGIIGTLLILLR